MAEAYSECRCFSGGRTNIVSGRSTPAAHGFSRPSWACAGWSHCLPGTAPPFCCALQGARCGGNEDLPPRLAGESLKIGVPAFPLRGTDLTHRGKTREMGSNPAEEEYGDLNAVKLPAAGGWETAVQEDMKGGYIKGCLA